MEIGVKTSVEAVTCGVRIMWNLISGAACRNNHFLAIGLCSDFKPFCNYCLNCSRHKALENKNLEGLSTSGIVCATPPEANSSNQCKKNTAYSAHAMVTVATLRQWKKELTSMPHLSSSHFFWAGIVKLMVLCHSWISMEVSLCKRKIVRTTLQNDLELVSGK